MTGSRELFERNSQFVGCAEQREAHRSRPMRFALAQHILRAIDAG